MTSTLKWAKICPPWRGALQHQVKTIRWKLYNIAGRVVYHSRQIFLKVRNYAYAIFEEIHYRIWQFCCGHL